LVPVPYKWISPGEEVATLAAEFLREDGREGAGSEELSDDAHSDCDSGYTQYRPRKRYRPWNYDPKRRHHAQKLRAKRPITPEFPNLRPKTAVRSSSELAAMTTTALGLGRPSTGEEVADAFVVPPVDHKVKFGPDESILRPANIE
jgi:hypothetical protein